MCVNETYVVQGLDVDAAKVETARKKIMAAGCYGQVSARIFDGRKLPYVDNLVNLIVAGADCEVPRDEIMRVLAPRGIALIHREGAWVRKVKPVPDDIDEWNQYLHDADNNGVSADRVGPPDRLQWTGGTRWGRSHVYR